MEKSGSVADATLESRLAWYPLSSRRGDASLARAAYGAGRVNWSLAILCFFFVSKIVSVGFLIVIMGGR
jgi:hypothetical protein